MPHGYSDHGWWSRGWDALVNSPFIKKVIRRVKFGSMVDRWFGAWMIPPL